MKNAFPSWRYGLFVRYVPELTVDHSGKAVYDINELADTFDAEGFAEDVVRMGRNTLFSPHGITAQRRFTPVLSHRNTGCCSISVAAICWEIC